MLLHITISTNSVKLSNKKLSAVHNLPLVHILLNVDSNFFCYPCKQTGKMT